MQIQILESSTSTLSNQKSHPHIPGFNNSLSFNYQFEIEEIPESPEQSSANIQILSQKVFNTQPKKSKRSSSNDESLPVNLKNFSTQEPAKKKIKFVDQSILIDVRDIEKIQAENRQLKLEKENRMKVMKQVSALAHQTNQQMAKLIKYQEGLEKENQALKDKVKNLQALEQENKALQNKVDDLTLQLLCALPHPKEGEEDLGVDILYNSLR
jgi:hypothetical protein